VRKLKTSRDQVVDPNIKSVSYFTDFNGSHDWNRM